MGDRAAQLSFITAFGYRVGCRREEVYGENSPPRLSGSELNGVKGRGRNRDPTQACAGRRRRGSLPLPVELSAAPWQDDFRPNTSERRTPWALATGGRKTTADSARVEGAGPGRACDLSRSIRTGQGARRSATFELLEPRQLVGQRALERRLRRVLGRGRQLD